MTLADALILGIIEGLTEFLPVSSTGHLILVSHLLDLTHTELLKSFEIMIQLGAILAVLVLYLPRLLRDSNIWKRIGVAFIPTGVIGFVTYRLVKDYLLGNELVVVTTLVGVGILLLIADRRLGKLERFTDLRYLSFRSAFLVGVCQAVAMVPGVSRSGATIVGGMFCGLSRRAAAEFSFLLAVPTMTAAVGYDTLKSGVHFDAGAWWLILAGAGTAFTVALVSVRWMLSFVSKHSFLPFARYRIAVGVVYAVLFLG